MKLTEQKLKNLIREAATEYVWGVKGLHSRLGNQYKLHTIGKGALKQIIKEELTLVLREKIESSTRDRTFVDNKDGQEKISKRGVRDITTTDSAGVRTTIRSTDADLQSSGANVGKAPRSIKKSLEMSPTDYFSSERYQDTGAGTRGIDSSAHRRAYAGKKRVAQTGRPEDVSKIGAGGSTVKVGDKVLKPGSKRYAAAINFLDRAETVDAEISAKSTDKPTTAGWDESAYTLDTDDEFNSFMKDGS